MTKRTRTRTPTQVGIESPWLTVAEAATYSRHSTDTIYDACRDGSLNATQSGERGKWLIHVADLDTWIRERSVA